MHLLMRRQNSIGGGGGSMSGAGDVHPTCALDRSGTGIAISQRTTIPFCYAEQLCLVKELSNHAAQRTDDDHRDQHARDDLPDDLEQDRSEVNQNPFEDDADE